MKLGLQRAVPVASERFHDALDELENEVRLAQTVLRRDLAMIKEDRKKREAASKLQEAEKTRLAAEARNAPAPALDVPVKSEKMATPVVTEEESVPDPAPDPVLVPEAEPEADVEMEAKAEEPEQPLKREDDIVPPPIKTNVDSSRDPLFDPTPTTANAQDTEFDFDAIFGDAMDTSGGDNTNDDMMNAAGDMDFSLDDGNDGPSLLRGLEDFAKGADDDATAHDTSMDMDFTMADLPDLHTTTDVQPDPVPEPQLEPEAVPKVEDTKPAAPSPAAETAPEETKDTNNEEDMMATMVADNLDDLFNLDEYENPENSSFDDAFFNFDN